MRPAPGTLPSGSPGADARSHGACILQTCPGPREEAGEGKGLWWFPHGDQGPEKATRLSPAARRGHSWRPQAGAPTAAAAGRLPLQPAARPARPRPDPGGQVPRSPGPQEPPGRGRSVPPAPSSDVSVSRRRGKGAGGAQEPALPAAVAASRNSSRQSPCAPQRSAAAGGSGRPRLPANARGPGAAASSPFLSPQETPGGATPPTRTRAPGGARGRRPHLLGGGSGMGGLSLPLSLLPGDFPRPPSPGVSPVSICRPG